MIFRDKPIWQTQLFDINYIIQMSALFNVVFFIRSFNKPVHILLIFISLITIITVHEFGHAILCKFFKLKVNEICIHFAGGYCSHESCYYSYQEILIAWGGVFTQIIVLLLFMILHFILVKILLIYNLYLNIFFNMFIYHNIFTIIYNLIPLEGLDGANAWSFITNYLRFKRDIKLFGHYKDTPKRNKTKKKKSKEKVKLKPITNEMREEAKKFADNVLKDLQDKNE